MELTLRACLSGLVHLVSAWRRHAAEQRYLAELNDYYLKDVGLTRDDTMRDSTESFWRR